MDKKIFSVVGATGQIGRVLVEELLKKGHKVRAIGRDEEKLNLLKEKGADVFSTDFKHENHFVEVFSGSTGVFTMIPPGYECENLGVYQNQVSELLKNSILQAEVKKVVNLSSLGAQYTDGTGPIKGLYRNEQRLNALKNVDIIHLRAGSFMQNFNNYIPTIKNQGIIASSIKAELPVWMVSTDDIAIKAAELLDTHSFMGKPYFEFVGPKQITYLDATEIIGRAIGNTNLKYVELSYEEEEMAMLAANLVPDVAKLMVEMHRAANEGLLASTQILKDDHKGNTGFGEFAYEFAKKWGA